MDPQPSHQHQQPYTVRLDPDTARQLATTGAALLLLDVPPGTLLGIDQQVFVVGPRFKGVKMVPPGIHLLSYQAIGPNGATAPAVSTFLALKPRDVVVRRWVPSEEGLAPLADEDEAARYAEGVRRFDFDAGLAPYDLAACGRWRDLTSAIDEPLLRRLLPVGGEISVMAEAVDPDLMHPRTEAEKKLVQQLQEGHTRLQQRAEGRSAPMETDAAAANTSGSGGQQGETAAAAGAGAAAAARPAARWGRCFYTKLPRLVSEPGATGAALTALNLDKSAALERAAAATGDTTGRSLLGELQFAYAAFLFGQSLEGFLQWKALLGLFLGCERAALQTHTPLFTALLATLRHQLGAGLPAKHRERTAADQRSRQRRSSGGWDPNSGDEGEGSESDSDDGGGSGSALGLPLVEELLPDSFLRHQFGGFFELLQEAGAAVPPALAQQATPLEALLRERLGWEFRVRQLGRPEGAGGDGEDSGDEDGPVVVELTEEERRMAGLDIA